MSKRRIYDVSLTVEQGMLTWPGDPRVAVESIKSIADGDSSNVSLIRIGTHTGTHIDSPRHFIPGAPGIDSVAPETLLGAARLFQLPDVFHISRRVLATLELNGVTRLLLGTRNSALLRQKDFSRDFAFVTEDAARFIVERGIKLVGIDYLSMDEYHRAGHPVHNILLGAGVVIVEGLDLTGVPSGDYELICLPLKIKDGDGAPARVCLREL